MKTGVDVLYLADSLGCMTQKNVKDIFKLFKNWKKPMGFHPHDNLNYALRNSLVAISNGVHWIDSTLMGMKRS